MQNVNTDTIAAQATPPGRGGIAVIRVSGPLVSTIIPALLGKDIPKRQAIYVSFLDQDNTPIDEGLALFFPSPNSFTGEDVLELHGHGSPVMVDALLKRLIQLGARLAKPGEFSERAFLNGKLDLAQAEAIADLIDASSAQAARSAMRSLQGEFSKEIETLNEKIIYLRMYIEAAIDFSEEEIDFLADTKVIEQAQAIKNSLSQIQAKAKQGSLLREGITLVISGEPNVGKSSLLNVLNQNDIAIVTDTPGTTRDVLKTEIVIDGIPMHVIDTAGLRDSTDAIEQEGIRRARIEIERADVLVYVMDAARMTDNHFIDPVFEKEKNRPIVWVKNKIDLVNGQASVAVENNKTFISISARTGEGIDLLKSHIKSLAGFQNLPEGTYLARRRHLDALQKAESYIDASLRQLTETRAGELAAEDLRLAHRQLCEITGEFTSDDLLGRIFSSFCVGK